MVSVVIPARNEAERIERVIRALIAQDYPSPRFEIILVDNLSTDATVDVANRLDGVEVLSAEGTIGAVRNAGIEAASGDVLGFIDADCLAPPHWLSTVVSRLTSDHSVGLVSGIMRLEEPDRAPWVERRWIANHRAKYGRELTSVDTISSFCFCVRREILDELGGFDPRLPTCEDAQLGYRIGRAGWTMLVDRTVEVVHLGNAKTLWRFFLRELWQGGSNLRNALGRRFEPSELASLAVPAAFALLLTGAVVALLAGAWVVGVPLLALVLAMPIAITAKKSPVSRARDLIEHSLLWATYLAARGAGMLVRIDRKGR